MKRLSELLDLPGMDAVDERLADALAVPAPPSLRARLVGAARGRGRLAAHVSALARLADVDEAKARAWLDGLDAPDAFEPGLLPGVGFVHLIGGARVADADVGFVRFPSGFAWPAHKHLGEETMLVLAGEIDEAGVGLHGPGAVVTRPAGSTHAFVAGPHEDALAFVVLFGGLEMPPGVRVEIG